MALSWLSCRNVGFPESPSDAKVLRHWHWHWHWLTTVDSSLAVDFSIERKDLHTIEN
jgi:hypothetical protein